VRSKSNLNRDLYTHSQADGGDERERTASPDGDHGHIKGTVLFADLLEGRTGSGLGHVSSIAGLLFSEGRIVLVSGLTPHDTRTQSYPEALAELPSSPIAWCVGPVLHALHRDVSH
jgi:hypothetical protein